MFQFIDKISTILPLYMLVFGRISTMSLTMPIIGFGSVPPRVRIYFSFILTLIIAPMLSGQFTTVYHSFIALGVDVIREVTIGMFIGFGARLVFEGFSVAGSFIGLQMGMAIMNVFDPTSSEHQPIISSFWLLIIITFFLVTNSHYLLIATLFENFKLVHLGGASLNPALGRTIVRGGSLIYELALRFAAPTMIFLLTLDIIIAFMARVMPQLNIFFISLPLKIGAGIFLLIVSLKIFQSLFGYVYGELETFLTTIVRSI